MGLYKLQYDNNNLAGATLISAKKEDIDYEESFENWLENSANFLFADEGNTVLWIGRQTTATIGEIDKYPDLIGVDSSGDLIIVELKKGKTPREVIAQILEYNCWAASKLNYDELNKIYLQYKKNKNKATLLQAHQEIFGDETIETEAFNKNQRMYIIAENITETVHEVAEFLRNKHKINISCLEYTVMKTENNEYIISTERIVGFDNNCSKETSITGVWNEPKKVKKVVEEYVKKFTKNDFNCIFTPKEIYQEIIAEYPQFNRNTLGCQIIADCVNHTSRKHYPSGQQDLYFRINEGKYRLYNRAKDGEWDFEGKRIR
jgi:hypothetical protein